MRLLRAMEKDIASYILGEFRREIGGLDLDRDQIVVAMGFKVALRFPEATISDVTNGYALATEMLVSQIRGGQH